MPEWSQEMIAQMKKKSLPKLAFIILSGYQEFEYVKKALRFAGGWLFG